MTAGGTNYGIRSLVSSGANKWNIYAGGTADNAFAGDVRIGSVVAPVNTLDVTGTVGVTGQLTSTLVTGTAPFVVASTTPVANLSIGGTSANVTGTVSIVNGGTGATDAATALTGLGGASRAFFGSPQYSLYAIDSRYCANPLVDVGYGKGGRFRFAAFNDSTTASGYADVIDLSTYQDATGGGFNSLYFRKGVQQIWHKYADAGGTSWTSKQLAYTDSNITGSAATLTTPRLINGVSFNGSSDIVVAATYDSDFRRIVNPAGGLSTGNASTTTGAIKITLPVGMVFSMLKMTVKVFDYAAGESFDLSFSGYNYGSTNSWINCTAIIVGRAEVDRRFTVRGGYTAAGKCCIYIGELASTWGYPQVYVTDVQVGYGGQSVAYTKDWNVGFETVAFENVTATMTGNQIGYATSTNTANASVIRDASGNFSAGNITADLSGTASKGMTLDLGGTASTFAWSGQAGQPTWLWGGNAATNMYVYNPSNFNVNSAVTVSGAAQTAITSVGTLTGLTVSGIITAGTGRPITIDGISNGAITIKGNAGGWSTGLYFKGSSGTDLGGYGALGSANTFTNFWIGPTYTSPYVEINSVSMSISGALLSKGYNLIKSAGTLSTTGTSFISLQDTVERGWMGYGAGNSSLGIYNGVGNVKIYAQGVTHTFTTAGAIITGTLSLSAPPSVAAITSATTGAIDLLEKNVGASGYATMLHGSTTITGGYRQHVSIGNYRTGTGWGGGLFVGLGGSDSNPTENFLLSFGGGISHSSGTVSTSGSLTVTNTVTAGRLTALDNEGVRLKHDSGYITGYNTANTVRSGYLQFVSGGAINLVNESSGGINLNTGSGNVLNVYGSIVSSNSSVQANAASGFKSTAYLTNVRNPIWSFGNADGYGLSYFQGTSGVGGGDSIGFHFGTGTSAASSVSITSTTLYANTFSGAGTGLSGTASNLSVGGTARGLTRSDSAADSYNVQSWWDGTYWELKGYSNTTYHAGVKVAFATAATSATSATTASYLSTNNVAASTNLNSYTAFGEYSCPSSATAATLTNCPTVVAFGMSVSYASGTTQFLWEYPSASTARYWMRQLYNTVWGPWTRILKEDASNYGISISGNAATASSLVSNATLNELNNTGWYRSTGTVGWYSTTYGGGIYMTDTSDVRVYANKGLRLDNAQYSSYVGDSGIVLKSHNTTASSAAQFSIAHNLGGVVLNNARGTTTLQGVNVALTGATITVTGQVEQYGNQYNCKPGAGVNYEWVNRTGAGHVWYTNNATVNAMTLSAAGALTVTDNITAPTFIGALSGNASTASKSSLSTVFDVTRNAASILPTSYPYAIRNDFVTSATTGTGGNYAGVMTYAPYNGATASTGGPSYQLVFGSASANGGLPQLRIRNGIDSTWNTWYDLYHSGSPSITTSGLVTGAGIKVNTTSSGTTGAVNSTTSYRLYGDGTNEYGIGVVGATGGMDFMANQSIGTSFRFYGGTANASPTLISTMGTSGIWCYNNITAYSDERVKTNWRLVTDNFVEKWATVKHGIYDRTDIDATQVGLSAQSVQKILPNAVIEGEDGMLSLNYGAAAAVASVKLAERIVEQDLIIAQLIERITKLENK